MVKTLQDPLYRVHCLQPPDGEPCPDIPQMNEDLMEESISIAGIFGFVNFDASLPVFGPI
jgi:hypothetical protein